MKKSRGGMSNEQLLKISMIVSCMAALMIVALGTIFLRAKISHLSVAEMTTSLAYDKHYVFISEGASDSFWESVFEAAKEEGKKQHILVENLGEELGNDYSVNDYLRMAISSEVDGILVVPEDKETTTLLEEADQKGIPVITLLYDGVEGKRKSFVGINSVNLGKAYGEQIKKIETPINKVTVLVDAEAESNNQNMICLGIKEALEEEKITVETKAINRANAFSAEESIRNIILSPQKVTDVLVCLSAEDTQCAYQALVDYNRVGDIQIMGYYKSDIILEAIAKNIIHSTIAIDTKQMGEKAIKALEDFNLKGRVNEYLSVDINVIDAENIDTHKVNMN